MPISNIQLGCALHRRGYPCEEDLSHGRRYRKSCGTPERNAAAVFPQQKITGSVLADPCAFPHLSSSPDLRIVSCTKPSQVAPMTDFRQMHSLHAYSGGTVRDSHPVIYSPAGLLPLPQALKWNINLPKGYHAPQILSIGKEKDCGIP